MKTEEIRGAELAAPQIRRVLSRPKNDRFWRVFYPIPPIFFAFSPFPRTYKTNFAKKIRSGLHFLAAVEAQTFCLNSGRVANAYSTDKYKYQNHENRSHFFTKKFGHIFGQPLECLVTSVREMFVCLILFNKSIFVKLTE